MTSTPIWYRSALRELLEASGRAAGVGVVSSYLFEHQTWIKARASERLGSVDEFERLAGVLGLSRALARQIGERYVGAAADADGREEHA